jgi:type IV pilus assembly protein PilY1
LIVSSNMMNTSACATTGVGYLNAMDAYRGGGLTESYFDINRNGSYSDEVLVNGNVIGSIDFSTGGIGQAGFLGNNVVVQGSGTDLTNANNGNSADVGTKSITKGSRRISWREIVK